MSVTAPAREPHALLRDVTAALGTPRAAALLPALASALRQAPGEFRLWHVQGLIHRQFDRRDLAIGSLRRAADLARKEPLVAHGLALTLFEAGLDSVDAYGRALKLAPGDPAIIAGLTASLVAAGRIEDALRGLEQIIVRSPGWVAGHKLLADLRWMNGERTGFTRSFDEALAQRPDDYGLRREHLLALLHAEHYDAALAATATGRAALGELPLFGANEAICHAELGHIAIADRLFVPFVDSEDSSVQVRRVRHLMRAGRADEASVLIDRGCAGDDAAMFWPYAATAWRLTDDPRWQWLEGDDRFVRVYDIADRLPPLDRVAAALRALHTVKGQPLEQSVRGGTQTDGNLFTHIDPVIVAVREAVRGAVADYVAQLPPHDRAHPLLGRRRDQIIFAGAWSVRLKGSGFHANHVHPQGWVSSALYIALPQGDASDPQAGWLALGEPQDRLGVALPPTRMVEPRPGRLVLFPSFMWHGTRPFSAGERLTIAFDVARPA